MSKSCDDMTTPPNSSLVLSGQKAFEKLVIVMCEHLTLSTPPNSSLALSGLKAFKKLVNVMCAHLTPSTVTSD
jgi:hypothetical protein